MKIFTYLHEMVTKNRKNILYILLFLGFYLLFSDFTFADTTVDAQTQAQNKNIFIEWLNGFLKIAAALLGLLTFLVWLFLYPEWTSGAVVGLGWNEGALKQMWIMISNVVYFIFAMIFIWIAFMNIIGKEENYELKKAIPKFIIWVIMVPFTWFFVQFVLSISSLLTVWVLSLPYDTFKDTYMKMEKLEEVTICKDWVINTGTQTWSTSVMSCNGESSKMNLWEILNPKQSDSLFGITAIYTYWIIWVDEVGKLYSENVINGINDIVALGLKFIFDIIFIIVYFLLMIALALALFVRWVYLWFYAMFSPVFGLLYFFDKQKDGIADGKFSVKEFISLALVPVYVSAALAFWLLFIFSAWNAMTKQSEIIKDWGKTVEFWWFKYTIEWPAVWAGDLKPTIQKLIQWFQWTFWTLLLQVFWLAILWMAVMAALNQSKITQNVVSPFEEFGKSIWQLASKAPTYMPIIPTGSWRMSAAELWSAGWAFKGAIEWDFSSRWSRFGQNIAKNTFWVWDEMLNKLDELIRKPYPTAHDIQDGMTQWLQAIDSDRFKTAPRARDRLADLFQRMWAGTDLVTKIKTAKDDRELASILRTTDDWKTADARTAATNLFRNKTEAEIQAMLWGTTSSRSSQEWANWGSPLSTRVELLDRSWDQNKTRIDADTIITINTSTKSVVDSDIDQLVRHLANTSTIWTMTEPELRAWLKDTIGINDTQIDTIVNQVKTRWERLDRDWQRVGVNFWKQP